MNRAHNGPGATADLGIEDHPVGRVPPCTGNADGGSRPTLSAVFAAKKPDVDVGNKNAFRIEGIEVHTKAAAGFEPPAGEGAVRHSGGINGVPVFSTVRSAQYSAVITRVNHIRIRWCDPQAERVRSISGTKKLSDPGIVNIGGRLITLFPHQFPTSAAIAGARHAKEARSESQQALPKIAVGNVSYV